MDSCIGEVCPMPAQTPTSGPVSFAASVGVTTWLHLIFIILFLVIVIVTLYYMYNRRVSDE